MAIAASHTNYAKNIIEALIADAQANVSSVVVENRYIFPDPEVDDMAFLAKTGKAILIRLAGDEKTEQQSDTWESKYSLEARVYVQNIGDDQYTLSDVVEDFKHNIFVNQSGQTHWYNADYESVIYNEVEPGTTTKTADINFFVSMRAI